MSGFYVFAKSPNKSNPNYNRYIELFEKYKNQQISYGNSPGDVLGYVYNASDISRSFDISKRAARRLIDRWYKNGVLIEYDHNKEIEKIKELLS